jgi:amidase
VATMPLGTLDHLGRPFSLAVIAKAGREDLIFQFLSAFEITFPKRVVPPQLIRTDDDTKEKAKAEV